MITTENITKSYGNFKALKGISFKVPSNNITVLLGPNGAGKTTTLRILAGYLYPDYGKVEYFGQKYDENLEFKKLIGYIPENNPVYEDLEVTEYLEFVAKSYYLGKKEIKIAVERCALKEVLGKKIGNLSKGYKQRVSLAKAILHNPPILLLDEPTTGLDPNQAYQTRELIKELKKDKTILISTHILSEAEAICDNILIINKGEICASGEKESLIKQYSKNSYVLRFDGDIENKFIEMEGIKEITAKKENGETEFIIEFENDKDMRKDIINFAYEKKLPLIEFYKNKVTLDKIFSKITKERL
ncbi:MAG TPA: ATP-binding cassette domain-containing protein [Elusimicrobiales bacterium]|nr:ATP-binding cassette domain-containing protein [Elusimicrobiales bacterium]HOL62684.1 ATP-binding cassette domain-containing protein [Elusimicrobiales bacterium]HPO95021.1 ATP-binding cassette domain-containing protein [Elusimicrobiales bacterium]